MSVWRAGEGGNRVHFHEEVLDLSVLVFTEADQIFAEVGLSALAQPEPHRLVLGPFAHLAAVSDAVTGFLIRVEAEEDDGVITVVRVPDAELPAAPAVPAARLFSAEMMSPILAADLLWEAQQLLDAGLDPSAGLAALESSYAGERYDATAPETYRAQCSLDLLVAAAERPVAAAPVAASSVAVAPAQAPNPPMSAPPAGKPENPVAPAPPVLLKPIATQPRLSALDVPAVSVVGTGHVTNMPRAAVPRTSPFVPIDWSTLPVRIVEEKISRELSLLRASWRGRAAARP